MEGFFVIVDADNSGQSLNSMDYRDYTQLTSLVGTRLQVTFEIGDG